MSRNAKAKEVTPHEDEDLDQMPEDDAAEDPDNSEDEDDYSDGAESVPDIGEAFGDPLFVEMYNYLLAACGKIQQGTNIVVTEAAGSALQEFIWEHLWLARKGYAEDEDLDPELAAKPMSVPVAPAASSAAK